MCSLLVSLINLNKANTPNQAKTTTIYIQPASHPTIYMYLSRIYVHSFVTKMLRVQGWGVVPFVANTFNNVFPRQPSNKHCHSLGFIVGTLPVFPAFLGSPIKPYIVRPFANCFFAGFYAFAPHLKRQRLVAEVNLLHLANFIEWPSCSSDFCCLERW